MSTSLSEEPYGARLDSALARHVERVFAREAVFAAEVPGYNHDDARDLQDEAWEYAEGEVRKLRRIDALNLKRSARTTETTGREPRSRPRAEKASGRNTGDEDGEPPPPSPAEACGAPVATPEASAFADDLGVYLAKIFFSSMTEDER